MTLKIILGVIRCVLYVTKYRILQIITLIGGKTLNTFSLICFFFVVVFFIIILLHKSTLSITYMLYFLTLVFSF